MPWCEAVTITSLTFSIIAPTEVLVKVVNDLLLVSNQGYVSLLVLLGVSADFIPFIILYYMID